MSEFATQAGYTRHASNRLQQRCIPPIVIAYLLDFGVREPAGNGAERFHFCKRGWRRLQRDLGPTAKHFDRYRHVYVVACSGHIITVAYAH